MAYEHAMPIDVRRLPADIVALIDGLPPDGDLVITRDGVPIATITGTYGDTVEFELPGDGASTNYDDVTVVATAMKLSASARAALSAALGPDYIVLDMQRAPSTSDVVLVPPVSPQLVGSLRSMFPRAKVVVTELEDRELGVSYHGPVRRLLDAGAETYLTASDVPRLAAQLDHVVTQRNQLTAGQVERLAIE